VTEGVRGFPRSLQVNAGECLTIWQRLHPSRSYRPIIRRCVALVPDRASQNEQRWFPDPGSYQPVTNYTELHAVGCR